MRSYDAEYLPIQRLFRQLADEHGSFPPCAIELVAWTDATTATAC
jgi:hypothetical protein